MPTKRPVQSLQQLAAALCGVVLLPCAWADDWPQWRGPARNGIAKETGLLKEWPKEGPPLAWKATGLGGGYSAPAIAAGRVYGMANRGADEVVWALSEKDGKELWVTRLGPAFDQRPSQGREGPACTPIVDGDRLYVIGLGGDVSCLQVSDGKILWQRSLTRDFGGRVPMWSYRESPLVDGDKVICTPGAQDAMLVALDKRTGQTLWKSAVPASAAGETPASGGAGGGPGGPGGFGGFSIAAGVAPQMFTQADANKDQKLSRAEFIALADRWFDRLDPDKTGKLTAEQFAERFYDAVPRAPTPGAPDDPAPAQRRPSRTTAPAFFSAADADRDGSLTRLELKNLFTKWYDQWDTAQSGALTEEQFRAGLNAALPAPQTAGPGGGPGGRGGGGGRGGFGGFGGGGGGAAYASAIAIDFDGQRQYVQFTARGLIGVAASDGQFLWRYDRPANGMGITCSTPLFDDGLVFAASAYGAGGGAVRLVKDASGGLKAEEVYFTRRMQNHHGGMVVVDGCLYGANGGNEGGYLACLDFKTGNVLWDGRDVPNRPAPKGAIAYADGRLYYRTERGTVLLIEPSPKEYIERGRFEQPDRTQSPAWAHPVIANGKLYLRDQNVLFCYDVKTR